MTTALFINGIHAVVLKDILAAQIAQGGGESFLQPHKGSVISMLRENPPTAGTPVTLYASTTENLSKICYTAEIVNWEDKRELSESRRQMVLRHLEAYQPEECDLFRGTELGEGKAVNLITIRNLRCLAIWPPTNLLTKRSDGLPLKERTRAGGWSEVYERGDMSVFTISSAETEEANTRRLTEEIEGARTLGFSFLKKSTGTLR